MFILGFGLAATSILYAVLYYILRDRFTTIVTFQDALFYSVSLTTTTGSKSVTPKDDVAKAIVSSQLLMVYTSLYNTIMLKNSTTMFLVFNLVFIGAIATIYKFVLNKSTSDAIYHATTTHTFTGHETSITKDKLGKLITSVHMILLFAIVFNGPNNGVFSFFSKKGTGRNSLDPSFYR